MGISRNVVIQRLWLAQACTLTGCQIIVRDGLLKAKVSNWSLIMYEVNFKLVPYILTNGVKPSLKS